MHGLMVTGSVGQLVSWSEGQAVSQGQIYQSVLISDNNVLQVRAPVASSCHHIFILIQIGKKIVTQQSPKYTVESKMFKPPRETKLI